MRSSIARHSLRLYTAGLVVLATGLGKTWLSAFDSDDEGQFPRVLFVAHREEILNQAVATFRRIRPEARFGRYTGAEKDLPADVLFASIQTLGRAAHLRNFLPDAFDYIVVDEFHHAAARTYRSLIGHFTPKFLLGLTATPETSPPETSILTTLSIRGPSSGRAKIRRRRLQSGGRSSAGPFKVIGFISS